MLWNGTESDRKRVFVTLSRRVCTKDCGPGPGPESKI